jgi:hypothetical protein
MEAKDKKDWAPFIRKWQRVGPKYLPEMKAWCEGKEITAKWNHDKQLIRSRVFKKFVKEVYEVRETLFEAVREQKFGKKMTKAGIVEWADNEEMADLFEEIYDVKEADKNMMTSKVGRTNSRLGWESMNNAQFKKIWNCLKKDMGFKNMRDLKNKIRTEVRKIRMGLKKCPYAQEMKRRVLKLMHTIERTRKVWDMPTEREFNAWWKENDFKPWE